MRKLKKQLFKSSILASLILIFPLISLYWYAVIFSPEQLWNFTLVLPFLIGYLFWIRLQYQRNKANHLISVEEFREAINLGAYQIRQDQNIIVSSEEKINSTAQLKILTEKLTATLNLDDTIDTFSREIRSFFQSPEQTCIMYLFESSTGELGLSFSQKGQLRIHIKEKKGDIFDAWVVKAVKPLLVEDAMSDYRFDYDRVVSEKDRQVRSLISVPMISGKRILGVLRVDHPQKQQFKMQDIRFLSTLADLGAVAIENAQLYQRVSDLAIYDGLTGLFLRRHLNQRLSEEVMRHIQTTSELLCLMIDVDHFKMINDTYGHLTGDMVLKYLAKMMKQFFSRSSDLKARYGGEEFVVLMSNTSLDEAIKRSEEFRELIDNAPLEIRRKTIHLTVSIGVARFPGDARSQEELISAADQALYRAKSLGRNRVVAYESPGSLSPETPHD
jgi:diguanylate cyclase (GGDEF)-like protein